MKGQIEPTWWQIKPKLENSKIMEKFDSISLLKLCFWAYWMAMEAHFVVFGNFEENFIIQVTKSSNFEIGRIS